MEELKINIRDLVGERYGLYSTSASLSRVSVGLGIELFEPESRFLS